jgi:hypothetical protein
MEQASPIAFEVEHITPRAEQGTDDEDNLALSCQSCNQYKTSATTGIDPETNEEVALFHPRRDDWDEHFAYDQESFCVIGNTPTGRATITRLRINSDRQIASRRIWRAAGLPF